MSRHHHRVYEWLATAVTLAFTGITGRLPLRTSRALGRGVARAAYYLIPRIRRVGLENLERAYGTALSRAEKIRILKQATKNVGVVAAELSRMPRLDSAFIERHITLKGVENIDTSRGALMIGAHFGNWEWMAPVLQNCGFRVAEVVRPLDIPRLNTHIDRLRCSRGVLTIAKTNAAAEVLRLLREKHLVGVLVDQSPRVSAVPVRFFGEPCWATVAPVMAAVRAKAPIHLATMARDDDARYTLEVFPDLAMTWTDDLRKDLVENSQRCQDIVEREIRRHPEQWLWLHRRWKHRPRLEEEWERRVNRAKSRS